MSSSASDTGESHETDLDPETEAAVQRAVRDEVRGAVRALSQIGGGLLFGFFALPALAGALLVLDVPITIVFLALVGGLLALGAYAWGLPPFN